MKATLKIDMNKYYFTFTKAENDFIGYCNTNGIKIDWKNFTKFYNENSIGKLEFKFYDRIELPNFFHDDMSGGSWLTNEKIYVYVNATWNFYEDSEMPHGVEVIFMDENDEPSDSLPAKAFYKFAKPTNLIELANYKQFYMSLIETLSKKYLVDSK